jgi:hypothetical protein
LPFFFSSFACFMCFLPLTCVGGRDNTPCMEISLVLSFTHGTHMHASTFRSKLNLYSGSIYPLLHSMTFSLCCPVHAVCFACKVVSTAEMVLDPIGNIYLLFHIQETGFACLQGKKGIQHTLCVPFFCIPLLLILPSNQEREREREREGESMLFFWRKGKVKKGDRLEEGGTKGRITTHPTLSQECCCCCCHGDQGG